MLPPLSSPLPRGRRSASRRRADGNVAAVSYGQHVLTPTAAAAWRSNTAVRKCGLVTLTFDLLTLSESRVTWSVPILVFLTIFRRPCSDFTDMLWRLTNCRIIIIFIIPRPLCSRVRPVVRDRQTDVRQKHRLMPPPIRGGGILITITSR